MGYCFGLLSGEALTKALTEERVKLAHSKGTAQPTVAGRQGQEAATRLSFSVSARHSSSAQFPLFVQFRDLVQGMVPPRQDESSHPVSLIKIIPHRHSQGPVSQMTLDLYQVNN